MYEIDDEFESEMSEMQEDVISYVAGFVCKKLQAKVKCKQCASLLDAYIDPKHGLIQRKDRGGLHYPSDDLVKVC